MTSRASAPPKQVVPIQVQCHAGFKADECPVRFFWAGEWIAVAETVDRWYQGDRDPEWPISDYFKVLDADGVGYLLKHDRESDESYLVVRA